MFFDNRIISADQLYTYDALYRLVKAEGREQQGLADFGGQDNYDDSAWQSGHKGNGDITHRYIQHYLYDAVGDIMQLRHCVPSNTAYSYTRNYGYDSNSNRLDSTEVTGAVTTPYAYVHDTRGNMTELPHLDTIYWNVRNELHKIEQGTMAACYQYGGGQRIRKYVVKGSIAEERIYLGSFKLYRKFDSGSLTIERHTVHISDDTGRIAMLEKRTVGDRLDDHDTEEVLVRYIYSNHLQSASLELDEYAAIISYEEYHPYGTTSFQSNDATVHANAKRYRYTGKERDEESGLYYHGARYYIPWLCRWSAVDPLESKYAGMSPYNYGFNNPIMFNDPSGADPGNEDQTKFDTPQNDKRDNTAVEKCEMPNLNQLTPTGGRFLLPVGSSGIGYFDERPVTKNGIVLGYAVPGSVWAFNYLGETYTARFNEKTGEFGGYYSLQNDTHFLNAYANFLPIPEESKVLARIEGGVKALFGTIEAAIGAVGFETGIGILALVHGSDAAAAGFSQMITGEETQGYTQRGLSYGFQSMGMAKSSADYYSAYTDAGIGFALSLGTSLPSKIPKPIELSTFRVKDLRISQTLETNAEMKYLRKLRTSIEENGISYDLSFDQQIHVFEYEGVNYLVNGHNRFAVAQKLGITELKGISISEGYLMERYSVTPQLLKGHSEKAIQIGNKLRW